jgi:hypothetical protein
MTPKGETSTQFWNVRQVTHNAVPQKKYLNCIASRCWKLDARNLRHKERRWTNTQYCVCSITCIRYSTVLDYIIWIRRLLSQICSMSNENNKHPEFVFWRCCVHSSAAKKAYKASQSLPRASPNFLMLANKTMVHAWQYGSHTSAAVNKQWDSIHSTTKQYGLKGKG